MESFFVFDVDNVDVIEVHIYGIILVAEGVFT